MVNKDVYKFQSFVTINYKHPMAFQIVKVVLLLIATLAVFVLAWLDHQ